MTTLRAFFENVFKPIKIGRGAGTAEPAERYRRAIDLFAATLNREPQLTDLKEENLQRMLEIVLGMRRKGFSPYKSVKHIGEIWSYAYRLKVVDSNFAGLQPAETWTAKQTSLPSLADLEIPEGLATFYLRIYEPFKLRGRSNSHKRHIRGALRIFSRYLGRPPLMSDLTNETVVCCLSWYGETRVVTLQSVEKLRDDLLAVWRFACRRGDLKVWPEIEAGRLPKRIPVAWTLNEMRLIIATCARRTGTICGVPSADWWVALILVLYSTGERISAVMGLTWDRIDLDRQWIVCRAEDRKGGREDRGYRIGPDAVDALRKIALPNRPVVFPWDTTPSYLWNKLKEILQEAGLPSDRRSKFHKIRRTTASYAERAGLNATDVLGHSDRATTLAYLDPKILDRKHAADVLERLM